MKAFRNWFVGLTVTILFVATLISFGCGIVWLLHILPDWVPVAFVVAIIGGVLSAQFFYDTGEMILGSEK